MKKTSIFFLILLVTTSCSTPFERIKIEGLKDTLEPQVVISTYSYRRNGNQADWFLRGYIDKKSQSTKYQLYITVDSGAWIYWDKIRFNQDGKLTELPAQNVDRDVSCQRYGCTHSEDIVVTLDRAILNSWSQMPTTIRLDSSRVEAKRDITIDPQEVKDFLLKLDNASKMTS